jgi:hypothetical protein
MFDVCTAGDKVHIDTIFKFLPYMRQHGCIDMFTAAMILDFRSARSRGNDGTNTRSLTSPPPQKKSQGVLAEDLGRHSISCWSFPDARPIQRLGNTVQVLTNLTVEVGGTSVLLEYERRYVLQMWHQPQLQRVQICHTSNGFFRKEEWTLHFLIGDCTKYIDCTRVTLIDAPHRNASFQIPIF